MRLFSALLNYWHATALTIGYVDRLNSLGVMNKQDIDALLVSSMTEKTNDCLPDNQSTDTRRYHLVLHFDINETILVGDKAGGDSRHDTINKMLAKSAFISTDGATWWDGQDMANNNVQTEAISPSPPPPLYIGWEWPQNCVPYYRARKKQAKSFVENDGRCYEHVYDELQRRLQTVARSSDNKNDSDYLPILQHMLPSFFTTLIELYNQEKRDDKLKITIVFRTMGSDLDEIAQAVSAFAQGKHPDYPDFYNPDWIIDPQTDLFKGRWTTRDNEHTSEQQYTYQLWQNDEIVAKGDHEVLDCIHSRTICGIQDDYDFWKANNYAPWSGKPVWKLQNNGKSDVIHHLLLDDNIHNLDYDGIAGVRKEMTCNDSNGYSTTFTNLYGQELLDQHGVHLLRVPTVAPILRPEWFVERIRLAKEQLYSRGISQDG